MKRARICVTAFMAFLVSAFLFWIVWRVLEPFSSTPEGPCELVHAIQYGDIARANQLIDQGFGTQPCTSGRLGRDYFPIHAASAFGEFAIVRKLLHLGADPNSRAGDGRTPLMWIIVKFDDEIGQRQMECFRELLFRGADVDMSDSQIGWSALHWAAYHGDNRFVEALLEAGASVNSRAEDGKTPLHLAASDRRGRGGPVIRTLLRRAADVTIVDESGMRPVDLARSAGFEDIEDLLNPKIEEAERE